MVINSTNINKTKFTLKELNKRKKDHEIWRWNSLSWLRIAHKYMAGLNLLMDPPPPAYW
jgi:hypothetical protein